MSEGAVETRPAQSSSRHKAYLGLSEGILDDLVLDQDEGSAGRALRGDLASRSRCISSSRSATRAAMPCWKLFDSPAQTNTAQSRMGDPEYRKLCPHRTVNDREQIAGQGCVRLEAEEDVAGRRVVP